jgi:hypothetical protein
VAVCDDIMTILTVLTFFIFSNDRLDDMVNQEIDRLKDFIKNRPPNLTTGNATMEEELYDAQVNVNVIRGG